MTTALLVIDAQESFRVTADDWAQTHNRQVIERIGRLVDSARARGDRVIWIPHTEPGSGDEFDPESGAVQIMSELQPAGDEPTLRKTTINAFASTDLEDR